MVRIAVCQLYLDIERPELCSTTATTAIENSIRSGAQIVVLPELCNSGYNFVSKDEVAKRCVKLDGPLIASWKLIATQNNVVIVAGLAIEENGRFWNASVIIDHSGLLGWYAKAHLFGTESEFFESGDQKPLVVDSSHGRIATMVCYDIEFSEWVRLVMLEGAQILALPTNWPNTGQSIPQTPLEVVRVQAAASQNKMVVAAADRCGIERGLDWVGASVITDFEGVIRTIADPTIKNGEQILLADVELPNDTALGEHNDVRKDRRPELYSDVLKS